MKVLIIGNGGREHAITWKVAQSPLVENIYIAPGNPGTAHEPKCENIPIAVDNLPELLDFAKSHAIDLTIVGPEYPLSLGIVDAFMAENLPCFGPTQAAAKLESSKIFSKEFMIKYGIPTARFATFSDADKAKNFAYSLEKPVVIKADGLAAGKGVIIAQNNSEIDNSIDAMLVDKQFGEAGQEIIVEEFLLGEEASFIAIVDGETAIPLATSQDHKKRDDGDQGPNTGGMGAYSPAPVVTTEIKQKIMETVINPVIKGMQQEGHPFTGVLYAGVMISPHGEINVLEFNCRLGDPETQVIIPRLHTDFVEICMASIQKKLKSMTIEWSRQYALGVVLAAKGYPSEYAKGDTISIADDTSALVFHAGTKQQGNELITQGGRVLCVTAMEESISKAQTTAYNAIKKIYWDGMIYRHDIGYRAVEREKI